MDRLAPMLDDDSRNALNSQRLDAAFVLEDYDLALKILSAGVADRDEAWHTLATTKVRAHQALQQKNYDEAIKQFRAFMSAIEKQEEDTTPDPTTAAVHSKETILGRNTKRIAEIYALAQRPDEAAKAYAEARKHFEKALQKNADVLADAAKKGGNALVVAKETCAATEKMIREELATIPDVK